MTAQPAAVVQQIYDAFGARDIDATLALLDEDVHWILPPGHFRRGEHHGREEMREVFESHSAFWEYFKVVPVELIEASDGRVFVLGHAEFKPLGSGQVGTARLVNIWTIKNGLATRHEVIIDSAMLWKALGGRPDYFE